MLQNLILLIITLVVLLFVGLLWLRHSLLQSLQIVRQHELILQKDFDKRRDTVPYLLESARLVEAPTDMWRKLAEDRKLAPESDFEKNLLGYLQNSTYRNVNFLDAKKDIEVLTTIIEREKLILHDAVSRYNEHRKKFPYSLACVIFAFPEQ